MDIQQLQYYLALAESSSFAKAADNLFISRQGLSKSIAILEKELGVPLFCRTMSGIELTEAGEVFRIHAMRIIDEYNAALRNIHHDSTACGSHIQYILPNSFWHNVRMDMFFGYFDQHPEITYSSFSYSDSEVLDVLLKGGFDFAVTSNPHKLEQLNYYPLFRNYRCLLVEQSHPLAKLERIKTSDLNGHMITVTSNGSFDHPWLSRMCRDAGFRPSLRAIQDGMTSFQYAESGREPTLVIGNICESNEVRGECRYLFWDEGELDKTVIDVSIVTLKDRPLSPAVQGLISYAQEYCRDQLNKNDHYPYNTQVY